MSGLIEPGEYGLDLGADLSHVDTWIFDLDNTLYSEGEAFLSLIGERMTQFVQRLTGLSRHEAAALQERYLIEEGATLAGLVAYHDVNAKAFLDEVHEVSLDSLKPDPLLREALGRLPGRRLVFTNGPASHAERVLRRLELDEVFEHVFHLEAAGLTPKPQAAAYQALIATHDVGPATSCFFEDTEKNLEPAHRLGMTTVLVGPRATLSDAPFVDYRADALLPFLQTARLRDVPGAP